MQRRTFVPLRAFTVGGCSAFGEEEKIMPLLPGKQNIGRNIRELTEHGSRPRSKAQILAIALHTANVPRKKATLQSLAGKK